MKNHLFKLLMELVLIVIIAIFSLVAISFLVRTVQDSRVSDHLSGKIKKIELRVVSPVFGTVESLPIHEGELVKKGDILAKIKFSNDGKDALTLENSSTFQFLSGEVTVVAPEDSIVVQELLAEGSTLKPDSDFLVLYPLKDSTVEFTLPSVGSKLSDYSGMNIVGVENNNNLIPLTLINTSPVIGLSGERVYYATFSNPGDSRFFYNDQDVDIKADKKNSGNLLFSEVVIKFQNITGYVYKSVVGLFKK